MAMLCHCAEFRMQHTQLRLNHTEDLFTLKLTIDPPSV